MSSFPCRSRRPWAAIPSPVLLPLLALLALPVTAPAAGADLVELSDVEYQELTEAAARFDHLTIVPPATSRVGVWLVIGDRFGLVRIEHLTHGAAREVWKSKQLNGIVDEVIAVDLDEDGFEEIIARTNAGNLYVWSMPDLTPRYESLSTDFTKINAISSGNLDDDDELELIVNADRRIYYLDGKSFNREFTSLTAYECTRMRCGDVDGDLTNEIVLNTGQVIDGRTGEVEWSDEVFGARIDLADVDGDGIPEVLSESDGAPLRIYDVDLRKEKHLQ
ncbi:MAG: hypothetical protein ACYDIE_14355 [Candidatus Krumholzibacteriia bacterium]